MKVKALLGILVVCFGFLLFGCETMAGRDAGIGAALGSVLGAGAGALISDDSGKGAIVGGAAGAAAGGLIGHQIGKGKDRDRSQDAAIGQALEDANIIVINVPTSTGGVLPVRIERRGNIWVGPKGETYTSIPTAEQLRPGYGF